MEQTVPGPTLDPAQIAFYLFLFLIYGGMTQYTTISGSSY